MARWFALPLVALVAAAVLFRLTAPRPLEVPVAAAPTPEPEPAVVEPEVAPPREPSAPLPVPPKIRTVDELKSLAGLRFHEDVRLAYAEGQGYRPSAEEVTALKAAGLSDRFFSRPLGTPEPPPAVPATVNAPPVQVSPVITVYAPVEVTVIEAPAPPAPEPPVQTVVLCAPHAPPDFSRPAIYQEPPFFKTHAFMPTKPLPTAEEVAQREAARRRR